MKKVFILITALLLLESCSGNQKNNSISNITKEIDVEKKGFIKHKTEMRTIEEYRKNILIFSNKVELNKEVDVREIESVIPSSQEEFIYYYSLTFPVVDKSELFYSIDSMITESALHNKGNTLFLFANMSEFVDGEYAESYYNELEFIISKNRDKFCEIFSFLSEKSQSFLENYFKEECNK